MITKIIFKELLENFNSPKFKVIALIIISTISLSSFLLIKDYKMRLNEYQLNKPKLGESRVSIQPSVLSIFYSGISKSMEEGVDIKPGTIIMLPSKSILEFEFFSAKFPIPDIGYIVKIIMSLLVIIFAFDTFSGEKNTGTLRLLFSYSISRSQVLIGKLLGHLLSIYIPFTFSFLIVILLIFISGFTIEGMEWVRILLFFMGSLIYIAIFTIITQFVSCSTALPSTSLVVCLIIWTCLTFGVTNLSDAIARNLTNLKSAQSLEEEKLLLYSFKDGLDGTNTGNIDDSDESLYKNLEEKESIFRNELTRYLEILKVLSRFAPIGPYTFFSSNITNSSLEDETTYKRSVLEYRNVLYKNPEMANTVKFNYKANGLWVSLENTLVDILLLFMYLVLFLFAAFVSFEKYDIR